MPCRQVSCFATINHHAFSRKGDLSVNAATGEVYICSQESISQLDTAELRVVRELLFPSEQGGDSIAFLPPKNLPKVHLLQSYI